MNTIKSVEDVQNAIDHNKAIQKRAGEYLSKVSSYLTNLNVAKAAKAKEVRENIRSPTNSRIKKYLPQQSIYQTAQRGFFGFTKGVQKNTNNAISQYIKNEVDSQFVQQKTKIEKDLPTYNNIYMDVTRAIKNLKLFSVVYLRDDGSKVSKFLQSYIDKGSSISQIKVTTDSNGIININTKIEDNVPYLIGPDRIFRVKLIEYNRSERIYTLKSYDVIVHELAERVRSLAQNCGYEKNYSNEYIYSQTTNSWHQEGTTNWIKNPYYNPRAQQETYKPPYYPSSQGEFLHGGDPNDWMKDIENYTEYEYLRPLPPGFEMLPSFTINTLETLVKDDPPKIIEFLKVLQNEVVSLGKLKKPTYTHKEGHVNYQPGASGGYIGRRKKRYTHHRSKNNHMASRKKRRSQK